MLSCLNLSLELQGNLIFKNFSLSLLPGAIYVLKGANGIGKTSLLKTIAGLLEPTNGEVLSNISMSYLGHENAVKLDLTVIENLEFWANLNDTQLLLFPAMAQFKLFDVEDIECKYLSSGWQKRISLARMVLSNTKLWLLDEPETNLDEEGREFLLKLLQVKIASGGMAIIASHNLDYYKNIPIISLEDFKYE